MGVDSLTPYRSQKVTFRERLNELRRSKGWSVKTLADKAGLPVGTVNGYLIEGKNNRIPNLKNAFKLANALGVSLEVFSDCSDWANDDKQNTSDKSG